VAIEETIETCACDGASVDTVLQPVVFRPALRRAPLTFSQRPPPASPAAAALDQDPRRALPQVVLRGLPPAAGAPLDPSDPRWRWAPRDDLLDGDAHDQAFVVEMDDDRVAHLRFGDGELGRLPPAGWTFDATYRVGGGPTGNVGAETLSCIVLGQTLTGVALRPRNPLPAVGGTAPESPAEIRLLAPHAFRTDRQRAIVADDYARLAERDPRVERASAALRWTGSWYEAQVGIQQMRSEDVDRGLLEAVDSSLDRYRRMGHDVTVAAAQRVPLHVEMSVCVGPHDLRGHVQAALLDRFSSRLLPGGQRGFFHPDGWTFGEGVAVSRLVAAAQAVPGVASVLVTLRRVSDPPSAAIDDGILRMGPTEIAQLDNDPGFPERGILVLSMGGGR
jgi:predicted phage baseplate assembly protein